MKLALVQPVPCDSAYKGDLGLAYLSAHLNGRGHELRTFDVNLHGIGIEDSVVAYNPDAVLVKVFGYNYSAPAASISKMRQSLDVPFIIGGPTVTTRTKKAMSLIDADIGIAGDGIPTINYALAGDLANPGIAYRSGGKIVEQGRWMSDPENWPTPDLANFNMSRMVEFPLISSVGCNWAKCDFCFLTEVYKKIMFRSVPKVVEDVRTLSASTGKDVAYFMDDNFLNKPARLEEIVDGLGDSGLGRILLGFEATTSAVIKARKYIERTRDNIVRIDIGAESFIQPQLDRWTTGSTPKENMDAFDTILYNGIHPSLYLITADHETDKSEMKQMVDFYVEHPALLFFLAGAGERRYYEDERDAYPDATIAWANAFRFISVASKRPDTIKSKLGILSKREIAPFQTPGLKRAGREYFGSLMKMVDLVGNHVLTLQEANQVVVQNTLKFTGAFISETTRVSQK